MNERIRELALECGAWHQVYDQKRFMLDSNFDVEKFAKLVIDKCAHVVSGSTSAEQLYGGDYHASKIKKHFGVEE